MKKTLNIFYREPREKKKYRIQEKENNVTHALIVTIQQNPKLMRRVLNHLLEGKAHIEPDFEAYFQTNETIKPIIRGRKKRVLLFINSKFNLDEHESEELSKKYSRPDGLVLDENSAIVIEAKVNAVKDKSQIERYQRVFQCDETVEKTWEDIYEILDRYENSEQKYVLDSFKEFLEEIGLSGFQGIPFFEKDSSYDRKYASLVMKQLLTELELTDFFKTEGLTAPRRDQSGHIWNPIFLGEIKDTTPNNQPHYSIYVSDDNYRVDLIFHKSDVKKLYQNWDFFVQQLEKLNPSADWYFKVSDYMRTANRYKTTTKGPTKGKDFTRMKIEVQLRKLEQKKILGEYLRKTIELANEAGYKQMGIGMQMKYDNDYYRKLSNGHEAIDETKRIIIALKPLYQLMID